MYSVPPDQLGGLPAQNLDAARGNFSISAWAQQKITVPIVVLVGDPVNLASAEQWAGTLADISNGNINAKVVQLTGTLIVADTAQDMNPMGVHLDWCAPDYPDAADYIDAIYGEGGFYTSGNNLLVSYFTSLAPSTPYNVVHLNGSAYTQDQVYSWMNGNITLGGTSVDPAVRQRAYEITTKLAIAMGLYAYVHQEQRLWCFRSWLKGYEMQENPMIGGWNDLLFYWLSKE